MPEHQKVLVRVEGPLRTVTLNRPDKRNALDDEILKGLIEAFPAEPPGDERVAVLRANGPAFCSGMDLNRRRESLGKPSSIEATLRALEAYPLPIVAMVQGPAIAGGNELALHCDFVVASETAVFGMSLAQIGLAPTWFLAKKILEVAGPVAAREILLLGDPLSASRMHELGIIARVARADRLEECAGQIVDRLAANAPGSLRLMKETLVRQMRVWDGLEHADLDTRVAALGKSEDAREGIAARLERRAPRFRGR